jgi:hypothetical protein
MNKTLFLTLCLVALSIQIQAQFWQGTYNTQFGTVTLVEENGLVYGDYGNNGTIVAVTFHDCLYGVFHNGANKGKFYWQKKGGGNLAESLSLDEVTGHYAYDNDIEIDVIKNNSTFFKPDFPNKIDKMKWWAKRTDKQQPTNLKNALFNGKWKSQYGVLELNQVGNRVKGKYGTVGKIDATYNASTKKLEGSFTNGNQTGYLSLDAKIGGNSFSGKWGWTKEMGEADAWTWLKSLKTNAIQTSNRTNTNDVPPPSNPVNEKKVRVTVAAKQLISGGDIYGFWGFKLFKVTQSGRVQVQSFGNKGSDIYNETENSSKLIRSKNYFFPDTPDNRREFLLDKNDVDNPEIEFEVEAYIHAKGKRLGSNPDFGKQKSVYSLRKDSDKIKVIDCLSDDGHLYYSIKISKENL